MAIDFKNNKNSTSAEDLLGKLGRVKKEPEIEPQIEDDSELDLTELLEKYLPDYADEDAEETVETSHEEEKPLTKDDLLMSALDDAFSEDIGPGFINEYELQHEDAPAVEAEPEEVLTELYDEDSDGEEEAYGDEAEYETYEESEAELFEEYEDEPKKKGGIFGWLKGKFGKNPEDDTTDLEPAEYEAEDEPAETFEDEIDEYAELAEEADAEADEELDAEPEEADFAKDDSAELYDDVIDPTDINLMVAFGLDGGDDKKADRAKALGDRLEAHQANREGNKFKLDRPEFVDRVQIAEINEEHKRRMRGLWIKLGIAAVAALVLMIFENIAPITKLLSGVERQFAGAIDPAVYPTVYIMVSLQLMLIACLAAMTQIYEGVKYLIRGIPKPESLLAVLTLAGIIYSAVLPATVKPGVEPVMFNFVVALAAVLTLVYDIWNTKREIMNFNIIIDQRDKHIVRRMPDDECESEARAFSEVEDICDIMKIERTDFVEGFFARIKKPDPATSAFMVVFIGLAAAISVLFGIFAALLGEDGSSICRVIYTTFLVASPLSIFVTFAYPLYRANIIANDYESAIIGDTSLDEYSNTSIVTFDDKNVFPSYSVKVQNIRIYNNARIDRVLYYAASVFAKAGGPLKDVFELATKDIENSDEVRIYECDRGFLATEVDGVNIIFGGGDALASRGFEIPENIARDDVDLSHELSIMYMFREDKLVAKMYIKYAIDPDIEAILQQYEGNGLYICVRTYDPNIDEDMISEMVDMKHVPLKIIRYNDVEDVVKYDTKVDSGLATCGSPKSLLQIIAYCSKVIHTKKTNIALCILSLMISVALLVVLLMSNSYGIVSSLLIAVYQLIWTIPVLVSTKMFVR